MELKGYYRVMYFSANWQGEIFEKKGKCKNDRHWLTKHIERYEGKLRYRVIPMMQREGGRMSLILKKERKLSLI